jgi:hypothetical protein
MVSDGSLIVEYRLAAEHPRQAIVIAKALFKEDYPGNSVPFVEQDLVRPVEKGIETKYYFQPTGKKKTGGRKSQLQLPL